jgi:RNA polymerase sigma factor (sigma-70 family)
MDVADALEIAFDGTDKVRPVVEHRAEPTDISALADRLRRGERDAARDFVDLFHKDVYCLMRRFGHDRFVSEDLTQETFLRAWYHIGQLRENKALRSWLYRIACNVSRLHARRARREKSSRTENMDSSGTDDTLSARIEFSEDLVRLHQAVAGLPWKLKQAVVLHYWQHLSIAEAAEAAGVLQGTFKSRVNRAINGDCSIVTWM